MRILIAEDDAVSRTILRRAVEKIGHECLASADGEEMPGSRSRSESGSKPGGGSKSDMRSKSAGR